MLSFSFKAVFRREETGEPKGNLYSYSTFDGDIKLYLSLARFMKDKASHHLHNPLLFGMLILLIKTLFYLRTGLQHLNKILIFNQYILCHSILQVVFF